MGGPIRISLAQINPTVGDVQGNADLILKRWRELDAASDLVVFPELALSGYPPEDLVLKPVFLDQLEAHISQIQKAGTELKSAALIPAPWRMDGKVHNCALLIENGEITAQIGKHHLPNYGVFDEYRVFKSAPLPAPVSFRGHQLGIMICEDMWFEDAAAGLKQQGAEVLIVPNGSPYDQHKNYLRLDIARARVEETGLPLIYLNQIGGQDELVFDGTSFALNSAGEPICVLKSFGEDAHTLVLESGELMHQGEAKRPSTRDKNEEIYEALKLGLHDYITKNGFPGVLIGLSGGVDSALSAVIAADAIGPDKVRAVMMPSEFTSQESLDDAKALADNIGVKLEDISIAPPVSAFKEVLTPKLPGDAPGITFENLQSRSRGLILMALSNAGGHMVLSTGNKSEMAVGYATLYGDMCGGYNVLKDIYKTQVYDLCEWRNKQGSAPVIPQNILTKAPTAELRANQTDQDSLPEYDVLDEILFCLIEQEMDLAEIVAKGHERDTVIRVWKMLDRAEYKRRQAPPGVKITDRAFGRDRRYPITNHFVKHIENRSV